jgi:glycosyltransferase involved in cell wall biosynthesis
MAYLLHSGRDYRAAGVSVYTANLLAALSRVSSCHELIAFHGRDGRTTTGVRSVLSPIATSGPIGRILWEQTGFAWQAAPWGLDLLHGTVNVLPLSWRGPAVLTVHDLAFLRHPDRFAAAKAAYLSTMVRRSVTRARRILAVSGNTRDDLVTMLHADRDRIDVIYPGVDPQFHPRQADELANFRRERSIDRPYILHVGTLEPRKNIDVLIRAFVAGRKSGWPHALLLIGARGWMYEPLLEMVKGLGFERDIRFLDFVDHAELPLWYNCADLLAYPSAYEGFGLPVLEAMACGVPVVTSSSSSLTELAAGACLTVEPGSEDGLQMAIARILTGRELVSKLRAAGLARAATFTWERTARQTIETYERAV